MSPLVYFMMCCRHPSYPWLWLVAFPKTQEPYKYIFVGCGEHSQKLNSLIHTGSLWLMCISKNPIALYILGYGWCTFPKTSRWPDSPYYLCPQTRLTLISPLFLITIILLFSSKPKFSCFTHNHNSLVFLITLILWFSS